LNASRADSVPSPVDCLKVPAPLLGEESIPGTEFEIE